MTKKEWLRTYNEIYDKATRLFNKYNPCEFNKKGECASYRKSKKKGYHHVINCCNYESPCKHLSKNPKKPGCKTKNLSCKLFVCDYIREKYPKLREKTYGLRGIAERKLSYFGNCYPSMNQIVKSKTCDYCNKFVPIHNDSGYYNSNFACGKCYKEPMKYENIRLDKDKVTELLKIIDTLDKFKDSDVSDEYYNTWDKCKQQLEDIGIKLGCNDYGDDYCLNFNGIKHLLKQIIKY